MQKVIILPCGHEAQNTQAFEIACPTCWKLFRRVGVSEHYESVQKQPQQVVVR